MCINDLPALDITLPSVSIGQYVLYYPRDRKYVALFPPDHELGESTENQDRQVENDDNNSSRNRIGKSGGGSLEARLEALKNRQQDITVSTTLEFHLTQ
jgi:hypothetical protein